MTKCSHGVYIPDGDSKARYCQICTPGSSGGIMQHDQPTIDPDELRKTCPRCSKTNCSFDFETDIFVCLECGFTL
jgi:hypothetical protein